MRNALSVWRNRNPFSEFLSLQNDLEKFFGDGEWAAALPSTSLARDWNPHAAIAEDDSAYHVRVDLPGVPKDQIKIDLRENILTISGERREEKKSDKEKNHYSEMFYGSFTRSFTLPQSVDAEKVNAKFENGVLNIELAKVAKSQARQIAVR